jgi:hypothetical protein
LADNWSIKQNYLEFKPVILKSIEIPMFYILFEFKESFNLAFCDEFTLGFLNAQVKIGI